MSSIPPLRCGEALCKKPVSFPADATKPWPVQCETCGAHLYPREILESTLHARELEPQRAELKQLVDGRLVSCSMEDMRRWFQAQQSSQDPATPMINLLDLVDSAPPAAAAPPPPVVSRPASSQPFPPQPPAQAGVGCYRDGDTLLLLHVGEPHVAFPDRCVVCNKYVRRAYLEHNQKSVFRESFYIQKTRFLIPLPGLLLRGYQERSIDVDYTVCDKHRARRWFGLLWMAAAVVAFVAPFVTFNLGLHSAHVLFVIWPVGWIGGLLLFRKGSRSFSPMEMTEIGPTSARFRVGRPFLESFPEKARSG